MTEKLSVDSRFETIAANLAFIRNEVADAAVQSGRRPEDIRLMAVTKTVEPIFINYAISCGVDLIGENKVQELLSKEEYLNLDGVDVHLIGHLQTNKVKYLMDTAAMIHSVDSEKLAAAISAAAVKAGRVMPVLLEVNMAGEESKFGLSPDEVLPLIMRIKDLPGLSVRGLMTIAPYTENPETNRDYFRKLRELAVDINEKSIDNINMYELSMGMTGDFEVAIEEGATFVRIGTAIFGERYVI
jgi:pyridoxal phosphate enzyme (YggS family)